MGSDEQAARYALYFAPPRDNPWWTLLSSWLGYDASTRAEIPQLEIPLPATLNLFDITVHPRQYGAHATLKAPFRLSAGRTEAGLLQAVDAFAVQHTTFALPALKVEHLENFIALVPAFTDERINRIADDCTMQFDGFRAPLTETEMTRRLREPLDTVSLNLLHRWGYPHVLERYRFHLSLTGSLAGLAQPVIAEIHSAARNVFGALSGVSVPFDAICVFRQENPAARFALLHRAAMAT